MPNPYHDPATGQFTTKSGRSAGSVDAQAAAIAARWSAMSPEQQRAERRRIIAASVESDTSYQRRRRHGGGVSVDAQAGAIAARWSAMSPEQQRAERRRIITASVESDTSYRQRQRRASDSPAKRRRRPTEWWRVDPGRDTAVSSGGSRISNISKVNNSALKGLYGAEGTQQFGSALGKADEQTRTAWRLGFRNPRAHKRFRVDE